MTVPATSGPTILVGYGVYGHDVLAGLLLKAASRGVLAWEEPRVGAGISTRSLRNLGLLAVHSHTAHGADNQFHEDAAVSEIFEDVLRQIRTVEVDSDETRFVVELQSAKRRVFSSGAAAAAAPGSSPTLDVIVLAKPTDRAMLGELERILVPALETLANDRSLDQSSGLNFILVLDFENYWDRTRAWADFRREIVDWLRRLVGRGFGRVYILDGSTGEHRDSRLRTDDVVLLLEFLLFEGHRGSQQFRRLYQRDGINGHPLATVGMMLFERNIGVQVQLAAACLAVGAPLGWLRYMIDTGPENLDNETLGRLRKFLIEFTPDDRWSSDLQRALREVIEAEARQLEDKCFAKGAMAADWPTHVHSVWDGARERIRETLAEAGQRGAREFVAAKRPDKFGQGLDETVTRALNDDSASLGSVIHELETFMGKLEAFIETTKSAEVPETGSQPFDGDDPLAAVAEVHGRYRELLERQVDVSQLRVLWWILGAAVAAGLTPVVLEALPQLPEPDHMAPYLWRSLFPLLTSATNPMSVALGLLGIVWSLGTFLGLPWLARRVSLARRFYGDRERGRLADAIRAAIEHGDLRRTAERQAERFSKLRPLKIANDVLKETARVLATLNERRREIKWLDARLHAYLRTQGVDPGNPGKKIRPPVAGGFHRHAIESEWDLDAMLKRASASREGYRWIQMELKPFDTPSEPYSDTFLYPLGFLEKLSRYISSQSTELLRSGSLEDSPGRKLINALEQGRLLNFQPGINWGSSLAAGHTMEACAVLPETWDDSSVRYALNALGFHRIVPGNSEDRAYLLRLQVGIPLEHLVSPE